MKANPPQLKGASNNFVIPAIAGMTDKGRLFEVPWSSIKTA